MEKLSVKYLGLNLKSPLIVSSSRLTSTLGYLKEAEDSGAGAVVLKSHSVDEYPDLIRKAKEILEIPVIPSINCFSSEG